MRKWRVYGIITATKFLGVYEAETAKEAESMGLNSEENSVGLCNQCSDDLELDDYSCSKAVVEED